MEEEAIETAETLSEKVDDVTSRINRIIDLRCDGSQTKFSQLVNVNQTTMNNYCARRRAISLDAVLHVLDTFKEISAEWLLRGVGDMTRGASAASALSDTERELFKLKCEDNERLAKENERLNNWVDILLKKGGA